MTPSCKWPIASNNKFGEIVKLGKRQEGKFDEYGKCGEFAKFVSKQQSNANEKTIGRKLLTSAAHLQPVNVNGWVVKSAPIYVVIMNDVINV